MPDTLSYPPVTLIKRLISIIYDLLLLLAIFLVVGIFVTSLTTYFFNNGAAITEDHPYYLVHRLIVLFSLFISAWGFYTWFWTHGGQTLGMKTWRIQLISLQAPQLGQTISWKQANMRFFSAFVSWAVFGLGYLWSLIDKDKRCWHDIFSTSQLVQLEKK